MNDDPHNCPECRDGKCRNCDGTAWCSHRDAVTACTCTHDPVVRQLALRSCSTLEIAQEILRRAKLRPLHSQ